MSGNIPSDPGHERRTFQIHGCIGRGGFGEVYRATMESTGGVASEVAVKVLRSDISPGSDSVKRLRDEGRLLGQLSHPSIVKVHDLVVLDGRVSLVTEYVEGEDLDQCFKGPERMPPRALVMAIGEVASALAAAWDSPSPINSEPLRLIHRDVKPANIRIGKHGEVKLLDFGIARAGNAAREAQTAANAMMGSYLYMSPERFHEDVIQPPSDIFALGSVFYEGLAGERFFGGMALQQVYAFMLSSSRFKRRLDERLVELAPDAPKTVLDMVRHMMATEPEDRPTAVDVAHRCEDLAEELDGDTLKRWCRARRWPDSAELTGSLDGRVLTAGTVGTMEPLPRRTQSAPVAVSGRIPNAPPAPGEAKRTPDYTPPGPTAVPPPQPQALGAFPMGATPSGGSMTEPGIPTASSYPSMDGPSLGEPGLGDFSRASGDAGRHEPSFSFDGTMGQEDFEDQLETHKRRSSFWSFALAVGLVALVVLGLISTAAVVVMQKPEWVGLGSVAVPIEDGEPSDAGGLDDGEIVDGTPEDAGSETEPEPQPTAEPEPEAQPAPAPTEAPAPVAPVVPTKSSLANQGWSSMTGNPAQALDYFDQALALDPNFGDAQYGRGYALVKVGRADEGRTVLCQAKPVVDKQTANEIGGFLQKNALTCD